MDSPIVIQPTPTKHKPAFSRTFEEKLINVIVPHLPKFVNGKNLTLATIFWSTLVLASGWIGQNNIQTLWIISILIIFQYITDSLDGAVGRYQHSGLVKWGYIMDHFLDFIFICSLLVAYMFILPEFQTHFVIILVIITSLMAATFLRAGVTGKFRMSYFRIGPSELRLIVILQNIITIVVGVSWLRYILIINIIVLFYVMCLAVYRAQNEAIKIDSQLN